MKYLLIDTSGGQGHRAMANAIQESLKGEEINRYDLQVDFLKFIGKLTIPLWNNAKHSGNIRRQKWIARHIPLADFFLWPIIFLQTLRLLFKHKPDMVITTQPIGFKAFLQAIRFYQWRLKKSCPFHLYMADLPTPYAKQFFYPLKKLSKKNRALVTLMTPKPLLHGESEADFWWAQTGLPLSQITYTYTVQSAFRTVPLHERPPIEIPLTLKPEEPLALIVIGSQASEATLAYIAILKKMTPLKIVALLGKHYDVMADQVEAFGAIPLPTQSSQIVAQLTVRADILIMGGGGASAMELLVLHECGFRGRCFIHSEIPSSHDLQRLLEKGPWIGACRQLSRKQNHAYYQEMKQNQLTPKQLLTKHQSELLHEGLVDWERGNAEYLEEAVGAQLTSPSTFHPSRD